jgi:arylsulfatase A-like enzyme
MLLVVKPPKRFGPVPKTVDALVRLIDLGPTVLDALGVGPLPRMDGKSLIGLLRGAKEPARRLYAETGFTHASPDAFEPGHFTSGPRTFDEYEIARDGAVEMTAAAAAGALEEKDVGAYDGKGWLIDSRRADGHFARRCEGVCDDALAAFLAKNR